MTVDTVHGEMAARQYPKSLLEEFNEALSKVQTTVANRCALVAK
jgi:hypothetical protein